MPTLGDLRPVLERYAGRNNDFTDRLNLVLQRLLPEADCKGSVEPVRFAVYQDVQGNHFVTLGSRYENIRAGAYQATNPSSTTEFTAWCGEPIPIRNPWYETASNGPGNFRGSDRLRGIIQLQGRYTTFADWSDARRLRVRLEQDETNGKLVFRGKHQGNIIYSNDNGAWIEGVAIEFSNATVTTTQEFDEPPYAIIKTKTRGRVRLYSVDANDEEFLVGYYDPEETSPSYTRYKVPACPTAIDPANA